jgi:hypothetical protein
MTFINWSDSEEMLGLLVEYVADERSDAHHDPERRRFLGELRAGLAELAEQIPTISAEDAIERLGGIHRSWADDFAGDPVLAHVEDCIGELARIRKLEASLAS